MRLGRRLFAMHCVACHQASGRGQPGLAPPLVGTDDVLGSPARLTRVLLHGLGGELTIEGETYLGSMPRAPVRSDEPVAALLTFIRRSWGNDADPVSVEFVRGVREETRGRSLAWTVEQLEAFR